MALVHTLVHSEVVSHLAGGHFRKPDVYDVLLGHTTTLQLLAVQPDGSLACISRQPAHAVIRDLAVLPWTCSNAGKELVVSLIDLDSGAVAAGLVLTRGILITRCTPAHRPA